MIPVNNAQPTDGEDATLPSTVRVFQCMIVRYIKVSKIVTVPNSTIQQKMKLSRQFISLHFFQMNNVSEMLWCVEQLEEKVG